MLFWFTKNPAKSIKGIIRTGVSVTASYLSENIVPIIKAYPDDALYIKKRIATKKTMIKFNIVLTEIRKFVPEYSAESNCIVHNSSKNSWSNKTRRKFWNYFCPEVCTYCIHIIICFS